MPYQSNQLDRGTCKFLLKLFIFTRLSGIRKGFDSGRETIFQRTSVNRLVTCFFYINFNIKF